MGLGSTLPQATYQGDRLPEPDPAPLERGLSQIVDELLTGAMR